MAAKLLKVFNTDLIYIKIEFNIWNMDKIINMLIINKIKIMAVFQKNNIAKFQR